MCHRYSFIFLEYHFPCVHPTRVREVVRMGPLRSGKTEKPAANSRAEATPNLEA